MSKTKKRQPTNIDHYVAKRIRRRRQLLGLSQAKLADELGLTFQQVQKYEKAMNRVTAGMLFDIAKILEVPITYFYEDISIVQKYDPAKDIEKILRTMIPHNY